MPPHTYMQVNYAANSSTSVNEDYWQLTEDGTQVDRALMSNRSPDSVDPLISLGDSRTQLLVPRGRSRARDRRRTVP
ncbi:hypothetical protein GCM10023080_079020 [Streptomyces pseudoechinosporeus]